MKRCSLLVLANCLTVLGWAQTYDASLQQAAESLGKKEYCVAVTHFEKALADTTRAGAYDLAFGAVAATSCGKLDVAMAWLHRGMAKGLGQRPGETEQIVNDDAFSALRTHPDWTAWVNAMRSADAQRTAAARQREADWQRLTTRNALPVRNGTYIEAPAGFARYVSRADTVDVPYLVRVPDRYVPTQPTALVVYLHGGVATTDTFQDQSPDVVNEPIFQAVPNALVLYPFGRKTFGWVDQEKAFWQVLRMIDNVVQRYNVDIRRVYLGGMSNGATAAFWFAARTPSRFAGFYAFAPGSAVPIDTTAFDRLRPGTPIISVSAKGDSVYPYAAVRAVYEAHRQRATGWQFDTLTTGDHGFIYGPDGLALMQATLARLMHRK